MEQAVYGGLIILLIIVCYDAYLAVTHQPTISQVIWKYSTKWPVIPFALGYVAGHLTWPK